MQIQEQTDGKTSQTNKLWTELTDEQRKQCLDKVSGYEGLDNE